MNKNIIKSVVYIAAFCTLFSLAACMGSAMAPSSSSTPVTTSITQAASSESMAELSISGTVVDASMNTLEIETADGEFLRFGTEDVPVEAGSDGVVMGDYATVYYMGELDLSRDEQDVVVVRVVIERS